MESITTYISPDIPDAFGRFPLSDLPHDVRKGVTAANMTMIARILIDKVRARKEPDYWAMI